MIDPRNRPPFYPGEPGAYAALFIGVQFRDAVLNEQSFRAASVDQSPRGRAELTG
jgi:hypothetical protein